MATLHIGERTVLIPFLSTASSLTQEELGRGCREITTELCQIATNKYSWALSPSFVLSKAPQWSWTGFSGDPKGPERLCPLASGRAWEDRILLPTQISVHAGSCGEKQPVVNRAFWTLCKGLPCCPAPQSLCTLGISLRPAVCPSFYFNSCVCFAEQSLEYATAEK